MWRYAAGMSIGAAAGVALAVIVGLLIGSRFVGLDTQDPISYLTAVILLALIALIAVLIPASRALRIDPSSALRWE
jgi:putative ABC transport system permease protein